MASGFEARRREVIRGGVAFVDGGRRVSRPRRESRRETRRGVEAVRLALVLRQDVARRAGGPRRPHRLPRHRPPRPRGLAGGSEARPRLSRSASLGGPLTIEKGLNRVENHGAILDALGKGIDLAAEAQVPNLVCLSGNRAGMSDEEGLENCARALRQIAPHAERKGVTLCVELLNSKVDHKDYMADHTAWGVALVERVGSPRVKLLYDIYHMQIMEGDVIRTIREAIGSIAHFHTAGVPGRHEIDGRQELNYPAICRAIVDTGYTGFLAQEFVPTDEPLRALEEAFRICDV